MNETIVLIIIVVVSSAIGSAFGIYLARRTAPRAYMTPPPKIEPPDVPPKSATNAFDHFREVYLDYPVEVCDTKDTRGGHCPEKPTVKVLYRYQGYLLCDNCFHRWELLLQKRGEDYEFTDITKERNPDEPHELQRSR